MNRVNMVWDRLRRFVDGVDGLRGFARELPRVPNLVYGELSVTGSGRACDCTVEGRLSVGDGSVVYGASVPKGCSLDVGEGCVVHAVRLGDGPVMTASVTVTGGAFLEHAFLKGTLFLDGGLARRLRLDGDLCMEEGSAVVGCDMSGGRLVVRRGAIVMSASVSTSCGTTCDIGEWSVVAPSGPDGPCQTDGDFSVELEDLKWSVGTAAESRKTSLYLNGLSLGPGSLVTMRLRLDKQAKVGPGFRMVGPASSVVSAGCRLSAGRDVTWQVAADGVRMTRAAAASLCTVRVPDGGTLCTGTTLYPWCDIEGVPGEPLIIWR